MLNVPLNQLPKEIDVAEAIKLVYSSYVCQVLDIIDIKQAMLIECDRILVGDLLAVLYRENKRRNESGERPTTVEINVVDHQIDHRYGLPISARETRKRSKSDREIPIETIVAQMESYGLVATTIETLERKIRKLSQTASEMDYKSCVVVVPNFDLFMWKTNSHVQTIINDLIVLLNENPNITFVAFKDPKVTLPPKIRSFFVAKIKIMGISRAYLPQLVTRAEARRLSVDSFDSYQLHKYISNLNVIKLRKILQTFTAGHHTDHSEKEILQKIHEITMSSCEAQLSPICMEDIGGYKYIKETIEQGICGSLRLVESKVKSDELRIEEKETTSKELNEYEKLIPKKILVTGPSGVGKTLFCKALAQKLNAALFVVDCSLLKEDMEEHFYKIFTQARSCPPSLIVINKIDFVTKKTLHTLLSQIFNYMDKLNVEEMVFLAVPIVALNLLEIELLKQFQEQIYIPYPNLEDRCAIVEKYNQIHQLSLSSQMVEFIAKNATLKGQKRITGKDLEELVHCLVQYRLEKSAIENQNFNNIAITSEQVISQMHKRNIFTPMKISFKDIGGCETAKGLLEREIITRLTFDKYSGEKRWMPKGIVFKGPSGTGKTMLTRALADELKASIIEINIQEFKIIEWETAKNKLSNVFEQARKQVPTIILIRGLDYLTKNSKNPDLDACLVEQLIFEIDKIRLELVLVVAIVNTTKSLSEFLQRPDRFEYNISVPYPDKNDRKEIFSIYNEKYCLNLSDELLNYLVINTDNKKNRKFAGVHIETICRNIAHRKQIYKNWQPSKPGLDVVLNLLS